MKKKLLNESGSLSIAIVVAIIAVLSSVAMAGIASMDTSSYSMQYDVVQETHFLRSELFRGLQVRKRVGGNYGGILHFPERRAEVSSSHMRRSYYMNTRIDPKAISNAGDEAVLSGNIVKSLIRGKRGPLTGFLTSSLESKIRKYGEVDLEQMSFAGYHYFTDNESSTNDTPVRFWGDDVIWGRVHSNSDIVIQTGGFNDFNGAWPVFFGKVSTSGNIVWEDAGDPEQIFREGYEEEVGELVFDPTANDIRTFGQLVNPGCDILLVRSYGSTTEGYMGNIIYGAIDSLINLVKDLGVWTDPDSIDWDYQLVLDRTAVNRMTHRDTIWSPFTVSCPAGSAIMIEDTKLWLGGTFSGAQTWACSDTLFLSESILLSGTTVGEAPDSDLHSNHSDYVGIVSEESIVIKYGLPDVFAGPDVNGLYPRLHPNSSDIYLYAALCALGEGENGDPNYDGVFTFEYMHPHGSTTSELAYEITDGIPTVYDPEKDIVYVEYQIPYPDLVGMSKVNGYQHTGYGQILPFNGVSTGPGGNSWPGNLDYPFYNPLYPEGPDVVTQFAKERGDIILYGSVAQRRRGYVHRSNFNNPNRADNVWEFDDETMIGVPQYGGPNPLPGVGEGYGKDYKFDTRFESYQPPFYPSVHVERGLSPYDAESCRFKKPPTLF